MKKLVLSLAAVAAFVACEQEMSLLPNEPQNPQAEVNEVSILATFDQTKTHLVGEEVRWEAGDAVSVAFTSNEGVHTALFTTSGSGQSVNFKGNLETGVSVSEGYAEFGNAVYPSTAMSAEGKVEFELPADVTAKENGSFASGMNLSSAKVSLVSLNETGSANALFKNALSIIRFTLDEGVVSLEVTADGNLAGQASMTFQNDGRLAADTWLNGSKTVRITPESGVFTSGKSYNVLVYPGEYSSLSVLLTDVSGCTYQKTIRGEFNFEPSEYYTFTFNTQFAKGYWFIGEGVEFQADVDKVMTVYTSDGVVLHEEEITAQSGNLFVGNLPASVVNGQNVKGFAVYPSTAYNMSNDKISYTLPVSVTASTVLDELYSAYLYVGVVRTTFSSVKDILSTLTFNLPAGVRTVFIRSTTAIAGTAIMTVDSQGKLVAGIGSSKSITLDAKGVAGNYVVYVYSLAGADLTITFTDMAGATYEEEIPNNRIPGNGQISTGGIKFDKNGLFTNESFTSGNSYEF